MKAFFSTQIMRYVNFLFFYSYNDVFVTGIDSQKNVIITIML